MQQQILLQKDKSVKIPVMINKIQTFQPAT